MTSLPRDVYILVPSQLKYPFTHLHSNQNPQANEEVLRSKYSTFRRPIFGEDSYIICRDLVKWGGKNEGKQGSSCKNFLYYQYKEQAFMWFIHLLEIIDVAP